MKKIINILVGIMCLCMLATFASAYGDMTYHFNTDHVKALAFDCEDDECTQVSDFSGSFPNGKTTNNGRLVIRYPSTLQTEHGYAVYFVSPGYLPKEGRSYLHTYGNDNIAEDDTHITFDKKDECQSVIDDFSTINDVYENEPLQINISSSLDAETASAFKETHADPKFDVEYVPDELKNRYYSSDVRVDLTIEDSNDDVVETQEREFTWDNGNPIYMDETADVHFDWTPQEEGQHIAEVSTEVTDAQCSSSLEASSQKEFDVLDERPTNECYTLLNNLDFDNLHPKVGETLNFSFNKISNYADGDHNLYPTETELTYQIYNSTDDMIAENSMVADANSNAEDPEEYGFYWTPEESGKFTIRLEGVCQDSRCDGVENHEETIAMEFTVQPEPTYEVEFEVSDSDSHFPLENVSIRMNGETRTTNEEGMTTFTDLLPDEYSYEATKEGYEDYSGSIEVIDVDQKITFTMNPDEFDDFNETECNDGVDNDGDGLVDMDDPGCDSPQDDNESNQITTECNDGIDNDGDGLVDMNDPGCDSLADDDESDATVECNDGFDNDGDGLIDMEDPGCENMTDNDESDATTECQDGVDNDGDGLVDMNDPGCDSPQDDDESDVTTECQDGVDNDGDGLVDMNDPGCDSPQDDDEYHTIDAFASLNSNVTSGISPLHVEFTCSGRGAEPFHYTIDYGDGNTKTFVDEGSISVVHEYDSGQYTATCNVTGADGGSDEDTLQISVETPECGDGVDNDGDGLIDMNDPGCDSPQDNDESDVTTECQDGFDNDGDGLIDMNDPGCDVPEDNSEDDSQNKVEFTSENPPETAYVSVTYEHDIDAQSVVTSDIEYEKFKGPEGLSVNDEGDVEWTPLPHDIGEREVIIKATDGYNTRYLGWTIDVESKQPKEDVKRNEVVVSQVRYPSGSVYHPGQTASLTMRMDNTGDYDLDNLEIMVMSHSFGVLSKESFMDVDKGEQVNERVNFRVPQNARKGQHMLRIKVKSDDVKYTTHRPIEVR